MTYLSRSSPAVLGAAAAFLVSIDARLADCRVLGRAVAEVEALPPVADARGVALEAVEVREVTGGRFAAEEAVVDEGTVLVRRPVEDVAEVAEGREAEEGVPVVDNRFDATLPGLLSSLAAASVVGRLALEVVVGAPGRVGGFDSEPPVEVRVAEEAVGFVALDVRVVADGREVEEAMVEVGRRGGAAAPVLEAVPATEAVFLCVLGSSAAEGFSAGVVSAIVVKERWASGSQWSVEMGRIREPRVRQTDDTRKAITRAYGEEEEEWENGGQP